MSPPLALFVGERRSALARRMGVRWEDGRLAAKQLFDALRVAGVDPTRCAFCNIVEAGALGKLARARREGVPVVAMGRVVQAHLRRHGLPFHAMIHPAARGSIRRKGAYAAHVLGVLVQARVLP